MKVVLLKSVPKLGNKFDVKNVSDGYALNFLIPNGSAQIATPGTLKSVEAEKAREGTMKMVRADLISKNISELENIAVEVSQKANDKGHLFKGLHREDIAPLLKEKTRLDIDPEFIELSKPIKEIGDHLISVKVGDKTAKFKLTVTAQ
ncbi:50S ribosomal protein L9 [Candidatus Parcubacteria bacterium]|nr:50S ribosomal protein L9 [Candidatus Parcubacteria bacterium]